MALTEHGLGVADGVRGRVAPDPSPAIPADSRGEDRVGYPPASQYRGVPGAVVGRLDEVTAAPAPAAQAPATVTP